MPLLELDNAHGFTILRCLTPPLFSFLSADVALQITSRSAVCYPWFLPFPYSFQFLYAKSRKEGQAERERIN